MSGFSEVIRSKIFSIGSFIVPSTTLYCCFLLQYVRIPAARHQGAKGECTYLDAIEHRTILLILSVFLSFFQIILENIADYDTIK